MAAVSGENIRAAMSEESSKLSDLAPTRIQHLLLQRDQAKDADYAAKIDAAMLGIAKMVRGVQDLNGVVFANIERIGTQRAENAGRAVALERATQSLQVQFPGANTSADAPLVLAESYDAAEDALLVTLLLVLANANEALDGDDAPALMELLAEAVKMLLESLADGVVPGIGLFLSAYEKVNVIRTRRSQQASAANAVFTDLNRVVAPM